MGFRYCRDVQYESPKAVKPKASQDVAPISTVTPGAPAHLLQFITAIITMLHVPAKGQCPCSVEGCRATPNLQCTNGTCKTHCVASSMPYGVYGHKKAWSSAGVPPSASQPVFLFPKAFAAIAGIWPATQHPASLAPPPLAPLPIYLLPPVYLPSTPLLEKTVSSVRPTACEPAPRAIASPLQPICTSRSYGRTRVSCQTPG